MRFPCLGVDLIPKRLARWFVSAGQHSGIRSQTKKKKNKKSFSIDSFWLHSQLAGALLALQWAAFQAFLLEPIGSLDRPLPGSEASDSPLQTFRFLRARMRSCAPSSGRRDKIFGRTSNTAAAASSVFPLLVSRSSSPSIMHELTADHYF